MTEDVSDREISLGPELPKIPERLLLAHAKGRVLFIAGAGVSLPAGLPDFRDLVVRVYARLDSAVHQAISRIPADACNHWSPDLSGLTSQQSAETMRFVTGDYDVVLGMLERRIDPPDSTNSRVRDAIIAELAVGKRPAQLHRKLMKLADRGAAISIVTTNFDRLLERAQPRNRAKVRSYTLGGIPRPSLRSGFAGVMHIHGSIEKVSGRTSDFVISDRDFGEFYLRRRTIPDFIYDAARLFHLVLVGYSANDPPMRYLLNAVAADGARFSDFKERFTFLGTSHFDPTLLEDWRGRGITPIRYSSNGGHEVLLKVLSRWASLSAANGVSRSLEAEMRRIVRVRRDVAPEADRDLFDHLIRRAEENERMRLARLVSGLGADLGWLDALNSVFSEPSRERV